MSDNKKIRLGIIGLGRMGKNHLNILSFLNSVEVKFVSDLDNKKNNNKNFLFTKNPFSLLKKVDAVIISTPTSTHFDIIKKLGKKVKNIFVEKPLAQNFSEVKKIINLVKKNKINLRVGFIERFNPAVESLLKIIKKNKKIISFDFTRTNPLSSRIKDVDVVIDLMVHDVDLAILFNGNVKFVKSYGYKKLGKIFLYKDITDYTSGFICVNKKFLKEKLKGYYGDYFINLIYEFKSQKAKILELPFAERIRKTGESKTTGGNISYLIKLFYYFNTFLKIIIIKNFHSKKKHR